jgi:hypothetical protein
VQAPTSRSFSRTFEPVLLSVGLRSDQDHHGHGGDRRGEAANIRSIQHAVTSHPRPSSRSYLALSFADLLLPALVADRPHVQ